MGSLPYTMIEGWALIGTEASPDDDQRDAQRARFEASDRAAREQERYDRLHLREWYIRPSWVGHDDDGYGVYYAHEVGTHRPIAIRNAKGRAIEALSEFALCALMRERFPSAVRALDAHAGRFSA